MTFFYRITEKMAQKAVEDPLAFITNLDTLTQVGLKILPVLPSEYPYPIPRGIYELLVRK